jgi:hypothetical protein
MLLANELIYSNQLLCGSPTVAQRSLDLPTPPPASLPGWLRHVRTFFSRQIGHVKHGFNLKTSACSCVSSSLCPEDGSGPACQSRYSGLRLCVAATAPFMRPPSLRPSFPYQFCFLVLFGLSFLDDGLVHPINFSSALDCRSDIKMLITHFQSGDKVCMSTTLR